jgi:hypothetical protein
MPEPIPEVLTYVVSKSLAATVPVAGACTFTVCKALPAEMARGERPWPTLAIYLTQCRQSHRGRFCPFASNHIFLAPSNPTRRLPSCYAHTTRAPHLGCIFNIFSSANTRIMSHNYLLGHHHHHHHHHHQKSCSSKGDRTTCLARSEVAETAKGFLGRWS